MDVICAILLLMDEEPAPPPRGTDPPIMNVDNHTSTGLPANVAAALACFPLIGGLIFYILEKRDGFVRFYAMQSIIFGVVWVLFNIASGILHAILWSLPGVGPFFAATWMFVAGIVHLAFFVFMVVAMIKAFSGKRWDIPYIGPMARRHVGEL